jgi:hypothetical protein
MMMTIGPRFSFQIPFSVWVTPTERYRVGSRKHRSYGQQQCIQNCCPPDLDSRDCAVAQLLLNQQHTKPGTQPRRLPRIRECRSHRATFKEVADILGHRSLTTTGIYAKLDLPTLAQVALPWPGEAQ